MAALDRSEGLLWVEGCRSTETVLLPATVTFTMSGHKQNEVRIPDMSEARPNPPKTLEEAL